MDIKFDPHDENQFAVASENHDVTIYDLRNTSTDKLRSEKRPVSRKFKFSAHENRTLKCEWNPKIRNRLATSGQTNIKVLRKFVKFRYRAAINTTKYVGNGKFDG